MLRNLQVGVLHFKKMRAVIGLFCWMVVTFPNPIESFLGFGLWSEESDDIYQKKPIPELAARFYTSFLKEGVSFKLHEGFWKVGVAQEMGQEYVIGFIESGPHGDILCPFMARRWDLGQEYGKIKIHIDGNHANVFEPIFKTDRLNDLFYKKFPAEHIREVEIKSRNLPLIAAHSGVVAKHPLQRSRSFP